MKIYFESLAMHLKGELEYRVNFILSFLSQILVFFTYYFIIQRNHIYLFIKIIENNYFNKILYFIN